MCAPQTCGITRNHVLVFFLTALCAASTTLLAQGSRADYDRANGLFALTRGKVFGATVKPNWFDDNTRFWYRRDEPGNRHEYILVDAVAGRRTVAFDHARLAAALSQATGKPFASTDLPITRLAFTRDHLRFDAAGRRWVCDLKDYRLTADAPDPTTTKPAPKPAPAPAPAPRPSDPGTSPDGVWAARIERHNITIENRKTHEEFPLSADGVAADFYTGEIFWSPDSSHLVALRTRRGQEHKVYLIESSPPDQLQPKLLSYDYLKPGDQIPITKPHLFDVAARKQVPIKDDLFPNPWSLYDVRWDRDSSRFAFFYNQRGHQVLRILAVDARSGDVHPIVDEQRKTFIDYAGKMYADYLDDTGEIIWMSERDGWNHLYLYDAHTGHVKNQITRGRWVVRGVDSVDQSKRQIYFHAGGIDPKQDPYYLQYCRINFDGTGLVRLTAGDGTHAIEYSPDRRFILDTYSRVDLPPVTELRRTNDGTLLCELERADISELEKTGWKPPERFVAKGRDGVTDIYGVIYRPSNFDPAKKYPVLEDIYAGPHGSFVPKSFRAMRIQQAFAELGFIVVQIDGMGTSNRSKAFHDVCWKNLGDAGFPDRILWMKAAAAQDPAMDLTRVGIYGTSAGGQSALRALEAHGDFYKAAVADCGCHDNRMDKIWWNELWMGWPVGPEYAEQSNVTNASKLQGKLLLIVGELDHNVDPASTMQVVNALIKSDKDFEFLVVPGADHGGGGAYTLRRQEDFFVRNLLHVEPRHE